MFKIPLICSLSLNHGNLNILLGKTTHLAEDGLAYYLTGFLLEKPTDSEFRIRF
jgi:hypothetical protein